MYGAPRETARRRWLRYGDPENFRHRSRRVLRMSLINPHLVFFFTFAHYHPINKGRRDTEVPEPVGVRLSARFLRFSLSPLPPPPSPLLLLLRKHSGNERKATIAVRIVGISDRRNSWGYENGLTGVETTSKPRTRTLTLRDGRGVWKMQFQCHRFAIFSRRSQASVYLVLS